MKMLHNLNKIRNWYFLHELKLQFVLHGLLLQWTYCSLSEETVFGLHSGWGVDYSEADTPPGANTRRLHQGQSDRGQLINDCTYIIHTQAGQAQMSCVHSTHTHIVTYDSVHACARICFLYMHTRHAIHICEHFNFETMWNSIRIIKILERKKRVLAWLLMFFLWNIRNSWSHTATHQLVCLWRRIIKPRKM